MKRADLEQKYAAVLHFFATTNPNAAPELRYSNAFELLVAVILSAQCTDKRVNMVTPGLLAHFPTAEAMATASVSELYGLIKSVSYPNNKAKHLLGMAQTLVADFGGEVPDNLADLQRLPGVGRKTANVILAVIFGKPAMAVDTHVFRVSARLGLTVGAKKPLDAENQLVSHIPAEQISVAHHWLILHGRYVCLARKPLCEKCGLREFCDFYNGH